ncbi:DNA polymerase III subunit [Aequorivita echinoideorum]|uniref:DNA polymerase III subunit delta n=1 Tax=Aequorivita echinoideorum TaxID=1549647 RepID=A0ABS5S2B6_9FLAO|nr:DNA polymerase III subunit delta' [Aequorivita echinoideorum]MBT0607143.1 DNA polymerase III subunit delta' [Aequorivita echinoideorum]
MDFSEIIGNHHIKSHLQQTVKNGRIPHAQLFCGINGSGLLPTAIAYAQSILCWQYEKESPEYEACKNKVSKLTHPDLHFVYPVNTSEDIKKNAVSDHYSEAWREFVLNNPYASLFEWLQAIGIEKKQGNISKYEAESIGKKIALKSYEGGYKVLIIWMAENMNAECSNKILKIIEEPTDKTVLLLLTENEGQILTTIKSRCQKLQLPLLTAEDIANQLVKNNDIDFSTAMQIARRSHGDYNKSLQLLENSGEDKVFEEWFINWVRTAFKAKGNKSSINQLLEWSEMLAGYGRETQKKFLFYCIEIFRQALITNYGAESLKYFEANDKSFSLQKFAPFVHQNNIFDIIERLENASYYIERNGNAKVIFSDMSIQLTRLIHKKEII